MKIPESNYFVSIPPTVVPGMTTTKVSVPSSVDFQPAYVVVPRTVAPDFWILNITVGLTEQLAGPSPCAAQVFGGDVVVLADRAVGASSDLPLAMRMSPCRAGQSIVFAVQNINCSSRYFSGVVAGPPTSAPDDARLDCPLEVGKFYETMYGIVVQVEQMTSSGRWLGRYVRHPHTAYVGHRRWHDRALANMFDEVPPTEDSGERCACYACQRDEVAFKEEKKP